MRAVVGNHPAYSSYNPTAALSVAAGMPPFLAHSLPRSTQAYRSGVYPSSGAVDGGLNMQHGHSTRDSVLAHLPVLSTPRPQQPPQQQVTTTCQGAEPKHLSYI